MNLDNYIEYNSEFINQEYGQFKIGKSSFCDDVWDFNGLEGMPQNIPVCRLQLKFGTILKPSIKYVTKRIVLNWCRISDINSVKRKLDGILMFNRFISEMYPSIETYRQVNRMIVFSYFTWLLEALNNKAKPYSATHIKFGSYPLKELFQEGARLGLDVPNENSWINTMYVEMILKSPRVKKYNKDITTKKHIAKDIVETIIKDALLDPVIFVRVAVIIGTQTGMRIRELLSIKEGCIRHIEGKPYIFYTTTKTMLGLVELSKPANSLVIYVVKQLEEYTRELRKETGLKELFIHKIQYGTKTVVVAYHTFGKNFLKPFVKRWDLRLNGELIELTSHYFRHFFAQGAYRNGMSIATIAKILNHESLVMTEVYTYNLKQEINDKFVEIMSNPQSLGGICVGKIQERLSRNNPFKGKTERQIKIIMDAMRIRILANGICMHHPARNESCPLEDENGIGCTHCENFVTHKICLPVHRNRVELLEMEMVRSERQGNTVWYNKCKQERDFIQNTFITPFE